MKWCIILAGVGVLVVLVNAGCAAVRSGYASAPYRVERAEGRCEVRVYPDLTWVETPMQGEDGSFMRLFHYIGGQNAAQEKIAMTTPVFMERGSNATMAFVLPEKMGASQAPSPSAKGVAVRTFPGGRFAVYRFSGRINRGTEAKALAELQGWITAQKLVAQGDPVYGYFDPPWTPPFFRRNEVMLRLVP
jgi:hypothetical protein